MDETKSFLCERCLASMQNSIKSIFFVSVIFKDNNEKKDYSIEEIVKLLDNWISKHPIHLSATELILMRCDMVFVALAEETNRPILLWGFNNCFVCENCYENYCKDYPLR